ncbi:MAG: ATP-binding protein [Candidatus Magasanikbacteria bacterium]|jgi:hypothetical protein
MLKRLLFYDILAKIEHKNAIIITGMRQVGKTTLLKQVFTETLENKPKLWFDFENPIDTKVFEETDYRNVYERLRQMVGTPDGERLFVFIDEVQNYPEVTKVVKYLIDHYGVKFFITGSSNYYLKNLFPESLSGRKFLYILPPLSFREFLYFRGQLGADEARARDLNKILRPADYISAKGLEPEYDEYLKFGGFPEVVSTAGAETKQEILKNIFKSFFEKDLKVLSDYRDVRELRDLILLLLPRVGSGLDITKLAAELSADRAKIYNYLEFLQGTFLIRLLPKFSKSIDRAVAGGKKVYFTDNGILNAIGRVNDAQLLENTVVNQLAEYGELGFYNRRNTAEIDAILNKEIALEIKTTGTTADEARLSELAQSIGLKKYFIISKNISERGNFISPTQL